MYKLREPKCQKSLLRKIGDNYIGDLFNDTFNDSVYSISVASIVFLGLDSVQ